MTYVAFLEQIAEAPLAYSLILLFMLLFYFLVLRKQIYSVFDPLALATLFTAFGAADVVFLWWRDLIEPRFLVEFVSTEGAFLVGFLLFRPISQDERKVSRANVLDDRFISALYVVSSVTFIVVQLITYAVRGIPLLSASRLEFNATANGLGALERVLNVSWFVTCYLLVYRTFYQMRIKQWPRVWDVGIAVCLAISALLSGSKSAILPAVFALFYFKFFHGGKLAGSRAELTLRRLQKSIVIAGVAGAMGVIMVQISSGAIGAAVYALYERFASAGDVYFMAYPGGVIDSLPGNAGFLAVFGSLLSMFRLLPPTALPENLGFRLYRAIYGFDAFVGPNPRHNVFGVVYFGAIGAVLYSFALGLIVGFVRNRMARFIRPGMAWEPIYVFLAISTVWATTDIGGVVKDVGSVLLVVPALYLAAWAMCWASVPGTAAPKLASQEGV